MDQDLFNYYVNRTKELETAIKWHRAWADCYAKNLCFNSDKVTKCKEKSIKAKLRLWRLVK